MIILDSNVFETMVISINLRIIVQSTRIFNRLVGLLKFRIEMSNSTGPSSVLSVGWYDNTSVSLQDSNKRDHLPVDRLIQPTWSRRRDLPSNLNWTGRSDTFSSSSSISVYPIVPKLTWVVCTANLGSHCES